MSQELSYVFTVLSPFHRRGISFREVSKLAQDTPLVIDGAEILISLLFFLRNGYKKYYEGWEVRDIMILLLN